MNYPYELPITSGPCTEPLAVACKEKLQLRMRFATEARRFLEALNGYLGSKCRVSVTRIQHKNTTDEARKACEQAMDALEAHRIAHGC